MTSYKPSLPTLTEDPASWKGSSLLSVTQITPPGLQLLFSVARQMRTLVRTQGGDDRLKHAVLGTIFYEASTRTSCSFQVAMMRLGGRTIHVDGKGNSSAGQKGESLTDTIKCLECYTDATVLRHPVQGSVGNVIEIAQKPVLNAGDGVGEHPTQALLDVFTIYDELKLVSKKPLVVVMLGDLKHGRTVHSLAKLLSRSQVWDQQLTLRYCAPVSLEMPDYIKAFCGKQPNVKQEIYSDLREACEEADVLYVTRVQRERFESDEAYENVKVCIVRLRCFYHNSALTILPRRYFYKSQGSYIVDEAFMEEAPSKMIVLHPLPRVDEIAMGVDADPRAAYFRQMENGMFVRMALLALVLGKSSP